MLEATIWERVQPIANRRPWQQVAHEFVDSLDACWPTALCTPEQARTIGVKLDVQALEKRFRLLAKKKTRVRTLRAKALRAIASSGQLTLPPDSMPLWTFFQPERTTVITKTALARKDSTIRRRKLDGKQHRRTARSSPTEPSAEPPSAMQRPQRSSQTRLGM